MTPEQPQLPKVSVIIAVYNNKQYLADAIQSCMIQTYPNLDIWVIDDCSTEDVMPELAIATGGIPFRIDLIRKEEIESFEWQYCTPKPLHYIRLYSNGGPAKARNIGIVNALACGTHIVQILDSDDIMLPDKVSTLMEPIMLDPERVAGAYANYNIVGPTGTVRYEAKPPFDIYRLLGGESHIHSGCLINGLALKSLYPYFYPEDQRVAEDFALWLKIVKSGRWMFIHIAKPLTMVRSHKDDSTNSVPNEVWQRDYQKALAYR